MTTAETLTQTKTRGRTLKLLTRFLPYYKPYINVLLADLFCAALTTVCEIVLPLIVRQITNAGIEDPASLTTRMILTTGGVYLLLRIIDTAANYYMSSVGHIMGSKIEADMRRDMFDHLQKLSFRFFDNTKVGQIMSRITSDLFDVTEFAHHCPEEFFIAGIKIIVPFVILCSYSISLTLIVFAIIPPMLLTASYFNNQMREAFRRQREQVGEINARVEDSLLGVRVVRSFCGEEIEKEKFHEGNSIFLAIKKFSYKVMGAFSSSNRMFDGIMYITVVVVGSFFIRAGKIHVAELTAYLLYVSTLMTSIRRIVEFTEQFQRGMTGIERFFQILDEPIEIKDEPGATPIENVRGEIVFDNVSFSYGEGGEEVLSNISFRINPGEHIAIVGPSGSGKTTICNLIPRFYEPTAGRILLDGRDIRTITLESLRKNIGMVQQDVYLFAGTVAENIAYGSPGATMDEIREAARLAGALEFIEKLPNGFDTYVGERGVKLSGGQKQRISIARVFLKNPPILILDEATSALDNESERLVQLSLRKLAEGRTTLTIAHRLTTIRNATRILVLTERGIEEEGTHDELMAKGGIYSELYKMYTDIE
ncbi:MAG TPA: ABC transporter ATP-binding protein [Clostridiales bacterium]|nr:ABC transporter ATP-binding protein [Clostridiales bacterium]